jgi:hypothetical protein
MEIKPCQINNGQPCADKGFVCLTSEEDKAKFNKQIDMLIKILNDSKVEASSEHK